MKTKVLLASVAVLAGIASMGVTQVKAATSTTAVNSTVSGTTPATGASTATIEFTKGELSLLDVPNFEYGSHKIKAQTNFPSVAGTDLSTSNFDSSVHPTASGLTAIDRTKSSFLHVQDQSGSTTGWKVNVAGTVPTDTDGNKLTGSVMTFNGGNISSYWVDPNASAPALAPSANIAVTSANPASITLGDTNSSLDVVSLGSSTSNDENVKGGDYYTDFSKADSTNLMVPTNVQVATSTTQDDVYTSNLTWTLTAGVA